MPKHTTVERKAKRRVVKGSAVKKKTVRKVKKGKKQMAAYKVTDWSSSVGALNDVLTQLEVKKLGHRT